MTSGGKEQEPKPKKRGSLPEDVEEISAVEAAKVMGVTRQNVHHLIKTGGLRARKQGHRWLVSAADVRSYRPLGEGRKD